MSPFTVQPASRPFHVMAKPIGPKCNLDCTYCFYLEKEALYGADESWRMSPEVLEAFVRDYLAAQPEDPVTFAWQGGEPTLLGIEFFQRVVDLQKQYGEGREIHNAFQTNGTLLDDKWGEFLAANGFLIGLSVDGPKALHDTYRVQKRRRGGSFDEVVRGAKLLQKHGVEWNTLTCVNRVNSRKPLEVYRFLRGLGSKYLQFIPIVERRPTNPAELLKLSLALPPDLRDEDDPDSPVTPWSVKPEDYGTFMTTIFDRWVRNDVGRIFIQLFDVALGKWLGFPGGLCVFDETCGRAMALEHDGTLYRCDHYVYPQHRVGNILEAPMHELADSEGQERFGNEKRDTLPRYCRECPVRFACNGGCPKHRFMTTPDGERGLNYLCPGYKQIFTHIDPAMRTMASLYQRGQPPAAIMQRPKK